MQKIVILFGLPGAGKTTYAKAHFPEADGWTHFEADTFPDADIFWKRLRAQRGNVVVDATLLRATSRRRICKMFPGAKIQGYFFDTPLATCQARVTERFGVLQGERLSARAARLEMPTLEEGFGALCWITPGGTLEVKTPAPVPDAGTPGTP